MEEKKSSRELLRRVESGIGLPAFRLRFIF
jgi:hypothetical protein